MTAAVWLSERHFKDFLIFNSLTRLKLYRSPLIFASILTFSALISFIMHRVGGAILLGTVLLIVGLGVPAVYFVSFFSSVRKQVKAQNLNPPRLVYTLQFSETSEEIDIANDHEQVSYRWKEFFHAYHEKDAIYLFITQERAFLLPLAACADSAEAWSIIEGKLGSERCTRRKS